MITKVDEKCLKGTQGSYGNKTDRKLHTALKRGVSMVTCEVDLYNCYLAGSSFILKPSSSIQYVIYL
jgi:hypothetical protein